MDKQVIEIIKSKGAFICDMDGVIYHGNRLLPGVKEFVKWLQTENKKFLFLTNSSERSPKELQEKLQRLGIEMDTDIIAGIESEITTCLVLSGITSREEIADFPYRPDFVLNGAIDIVS